MTNNEVSKRIKRAEVKHARNMIKWEMNRPFKLSMRYGVRSNAFKASNCVLDMNELRATSYAWWNMLQVIKGKLVFNNYSYSSATSGHQSKVRSVLRNLGIKIDIEIEAPRGLQNLDKALDQTLYILARNELQQAHSRSKPNRYSKAWVKAQKEALQFLAKCGFKATKERKLEAQKRVEHERISRLERQREKRLLKKVQIVERADFETTKGLQGIHLARPYGRLDRNEKIEQVNEALKDGFKTIYVHVEQENGSFV